jgi:hypothetical protein
VVYACIEYSYQHTDIISKRYNNLKIGADYSFMLLDAVSVARGDDYAAWSTGGYVGGRNIMVRLNINDHSNLIDGVDVNKTLSSLGQNYPNPFNGKTDIAFELASGGEVRMVVRDITGRIVLDKNEGFMPAGKHNLTIDGNSLEAGIYMYTLSAGAFSETRRMTVGR